MSKKTKNKKVKSGQTVELHYVGTLDDGTEFDNSRKREKTISVEVGSGQLIAGFDSALVGMKTGQTKKIRLTPEEAYGAADEELVQSVPQASFPQDYEFEVGAVVQGQAENGQPVLAKIDSINDDSIVLDFNHPLAGKALNFEIELLGVQDSEDK